MNEDERSALVLDDQLCFALYAASRAMTARYRPLLAELDLTYPQYLVMMVLWDEGSCTVSQLGSRLRLDSGTLSPLLKRLEARGFITRVRRTDDERSVDVKLTEDGIALKARAESVPPQIGELLGDIDHQKLKLELRALEALLQQQPT